MSDPATTPLEHEFSFASCLKQLLSDVNHNADAVLLTSILLLNE